MYAAWRVPRFLLQALDVPAINCAAVLDSTPCQDSRKNEDNSLLCVSATAENHGVQIGMRASQALARSPQLNCLYRNEIAEKQLQELLLRCAETWTADFESTQPGLCVMDLRRVYNLQKTSWFEQGMLMHRDLKEHGYEICIGMAATADLALLASHIAAPVKVINDAMREEKVAFLELPISVLSPTLDLLETLCLWGINTLGDLQSLKRQAVAERLGIAGLNLWDLAHGGKDRLLKLVRPQVYYRREAELENGIETLEPLLHLLREFSQQLCTQLSLAWKVAAHLHLKLMFDDESVHQNDLRISQPTRDVEVLMRILETHLESVKASAQIVSVFLEITPVDPAMAQDLLFDRGLKDPGKFAETLSALEALLGSGRVGRGQLLPTHQSDAFIVTPFLEKPTSQTPPHQNYGLPLQRYRPPRNADVKTKNARPIWLRSGSHSLHLTKCSGPWLISGHWWDARHAWDQEIWDVAAEDGGLYRLVREKGSWKLEGRYG